MATIGATYLAEFRIVPPAFYGVTLGHPSIYFSGTPLHKCRRATQVSLALVHPQIDR